MERTLEGSSIRLVRDADGDHLEIDGVRIRPDEWKYVREIRDENGKQPTVIKSWWQRVRSKAA